MTAPGDALEAILRREHGLVLASLVRALGDFDLAEEALADAVATALENWPEAGIPENPAAWLVTVARRKAIDRIRRQRVLNDKLSMLVEPPGEPESARGDALSDDRLQLIFACCHPSLSPEAQVALTLKSLGGLTTAEVARAFLTSEATMYQRITRAKNKIRLAGIPVEMPSPRDLPTRLQSVLAVIYLILNEGHSPVTGDEPMRVDLCREAVSLAEMITEQLPEPAEVWGLAALCWLTVARRPARVDERGDLVLLADQDRSRWDHVAIHRGLGHLAEARARGGADSYTLQAEIAAVHIASPSADDTDWGRIIELYERLLALNPSPVVLLNLAVAVAMEHGPEQGLEIIEGLAERLDGYQPFHVARAELLARTGRGREAVDGFRRALEFPINDAERRHLDRRLAEVSADTT